MKQMVCKTCGSNELIKQGEVFVCQHCQTKYSAEDVQKMIVKIDNSAKLDNALINARRAMESNDWQQAEKYYDIALMEDAENWEAYFYSIFSKAMQKNILDSTILVANSIETVFKEIKKLEDTTQQNDAIERIKTSLLFLAQCGCNIVTDNYNSESTFRQEYLKSKGNINTDYANIILPLANLLLSSGNELVLQFGENEFTTSINIQYHEAGLEIVKYLHNLTNSKSTDVLQHYSDELKDISPSHREKCLQEETQAQIDAYKSKKGCIGCLVVFIVLGIIGGIMENIEGKGKDYKQQEENKKTYKTVKIGEQTWIAENLNIDMLGSKCYDNKPDNCDKYGRLYDWETAMKVCPKGYHLPSDAEWTQLTNFVGDFETAGKYLKSKSGWNEDGNGEDTYGFSALPSGIDTDGYWYSSTENGKTGANVYKIFHVVTRTVIAKGSSKKALFSVRCVKD
ncbi:MAG: fibrobacter succinogenes major paralogous domain-containing protein [Fibromonadaceae bacterium]|jgi:uncharacterized protein (TIGR02145 family)|nr:fibrobacter succinogenes major paralogous domain-containing protein [Fibromonadaceae bacterium]